MTRAAITVAVMLLPPLARGCELTEQLLDAIALVESGNNPIARGKHGERSAFQLRRAAVLDVIWFRRALHDHAENTSPDIADPDQARYVAADYLYLLSTRYWRATGKMPTLPVLLACWNYGYDRAAAVRFSVPRLPAAVRNYINRVIAAHDSARARTCAPASRPTGGNAQ